MISNARAHRQVLMPLVARLNSLRETYISDVILLYGWQISFI